ncbi:unnamed protein product [Adineta steineri]|uniref:NACHT domain-containing protein n=1 Tax=Adineta steineri TaxID=433720 RepID=A0A815Q851_9BILA|nr:unnamed protein product [Adineta steineri]
MNRTVDGVEVVCCFMTPEYQDSINCKNELQCAKEKKKHIIPCMIGDKQNKQWKPTDWLECLTAGLNHIDLREESDSNIRLKAEELISRIINQSSVSSQYSLVNAIKAKYLKEDKIKRILNEEDTFSIEQSYINLTMVNTEEQHGIKEKSRKHEVKNISDPGEEQDYRWKHQDSKFLGAYGEMYGDKVPTDIEQIFQESKYPIKKVLVLGRRGIGKSTFCQYVAYRWAKGELCSCYELIVLIDLSKLTDTRYPATKLYTAVDLVEREYASFANLSDEEKKSFQQKCNNEKVLWILDGYDEFAANIPEQLKQCFNDIRDKQNHILTSSSYDIAISHDVKMEIIGFTNDNIPRYVEQFFRQTVGELTNASSQGQKLLDFLYSNRRIWRLARILVNLELICRLWADPSWLETKALTMPALYEEFVLWLSRRHLAKDNKNQEQMTKEAVHKQFHKELQFLEHLAFKMMKNDKIIISSSLMQETEIETEYYLHEHSPVLQMGILKPYKNKSFENQNETITQYYFIHPSYQELFAACYLLKTLKSSNNNEATHFIKHKKYNQRFRLMFVFAAGLLAQSDYQSCTDTFWTTIQEEPIDLIGIRHFQLLTECIDELGACTALGNIDLNEMAKQLTGILIIALRNTNTGVYSVACEVLAKLGEKVTTNLVIGDVIHALGHKCLWVRVMACKVLGKIGEKAPSNEMLIALTNTLSDAVYEVTSSACEALMTFGEKAATKEVIAALIKALRNRNSYVRVNACEVLGTIGEKAASTEALTILVGALGDESEYLRKSVCKTLGNIGEKAATKEVIAALIKALRDKNSGVRVNACGALLKIQEKSATPEVIAGVSNAFLDKELVVRNMASSILVDLGEKAITVEVITVLINALGDEDLSVRTNAREALIELGRKVPTNELIARLSNALGNVDIWIRDSACSILGGIGENAATEEVITAVVNALDDEDEDVRASASSALKRFGEKAATKEVIAALHNAVDNGDEYMSSCAYIALGKIDEKVATEKVITYLVNILIDKNSSYRLSACEALGNIGETETTNTVLVALVNALRDKSKPLRESACETLGKLGIKAATNEIIAALRHILDNEDEYMINCTCIALGQIGEQAATKSVLQTGNMFETMREDRFGNDTTRSVP